MARFCESLWSASGRNPTLYSDFDIEMGDSPYSSDEVNELIAEADPRAPEYVSELTYVDVNQNPALTPAHGRHLVQGLISLVGNTSNIIAHGEDFNRLFMAGPEIKALGFEQLRGPGRWYVRPAHDY